MLVTEFDFEISNLSQFAIFKFIKHLQYYNNNNKSSEYNSCAFKQLLFLLIQKFTNFFIID